MGFFFLGGGIQYTLAPFCSVVGSVDTLFGRPVFAPDKCIAAMYGI